MSTATVTKSALKTPLEMLYGWESSRPNDIYMSQPIEGKWYTWTWKECATEIRKMAAHLKSLGYPEGSKIALVSKNCAHWIMADLAILMAGYISVPIYPNVSKDTVKYILDHSEARLLFVGKLDGPNWKEMKQGVPEGFNAITFPKYGQEGYEVWDDVIKDVAPMEGNDSPDLDDVMTIIYTSGTTGTPKGVVHKAMAPVFAINQMKELIGLSQSDRFFSYLPLSHIAERMLIEMGTLVTGGSVHFAQSLDTFADNLKTCSPTIFLGVPRIWTKFMGGVLAKFSPSKLNLLLAIPIINGIIKKKIKEALGLSEARVCLTGAAPTPVSMQKWYKKLGIILNEVYGMTENSAYSHSNLPQAYKFGHAGKTMPGVETKFTDEGEICIKSICNMVEYYKDPEKTAEALRDGFLHTGDCGEMGADGFLKITGRVKDIFKTSKAKYVAPNPIEMKMMKNPDIDQVCVVGTGIPQPIALVVPSEGGMSKSKDDLLASLKETLETINPQLEHHEVLQKIVIVKEPWTPENGVLTPTLKIKRNEVDKRFGTSYEQWYEGGKGVIWAA